ncbi:39S ribosomal protein L33, mitochondrial [Polyrhizophydium stewartii]|uniref:Large ribosomal subunit protein bL33m n=1 Tax=Polyrhizophydium stewartii TaxID=2732419 RepID=A0ABR4MW82_9FUNG
MPPLAMAAKAKARTIVVRLLSTAGTGFTYMTKRRRALPKLQLRNFDPVVNQHVLFLETKLK